jgi:hypothetical protein
MEINHGCQSVWITHVDVHSKGQFSDKTGWNQVDEQVCIAQVISFLPVIIFLSIIAPDMTINPSQTGHKVNTMFLMQKISLHMRLVFLNK